MGLNMSRKVIKIVLPPPEEIPPETLKEYKITYKKAEEKTRAYIKEG